jgi:hypothetical protein
MNIYLKEPSLDEYWYEQKVLSDPSAMEYNAGWDVSYNGYNYDTGCIDFPEEKWNKDFEKEKNQIDILLILLEKKMISLLDM